ncbi:MAG TPA: pyrroline-5-carboxylate reductase [Candidatus Hypogeohydataceae bacterium YC40]
MIKEGFGLIGAGKMGEALLRGILKAGLVRPENFVINDIDVKKCNDLVKELGVKFVANSKAVPEKAGCIILAVKPQDIENVLSSLKESVSPEEHLIISIAAGIPLHILENRLKPNCRVIRVMPNAACMVAEAASCYCLGKNATEADALLAEKVLNAVGKAFKVEEKYLDAVTGLSGSGPAYVALIVEALSDGGVKMGLPREISTQLAAQTLLGAAKMMLSGYRPAQVKDIVTSPGGTTIEGLQVLEEGAVRASIIGAVEAAALKSKALGERLSEK